LTSVALALGLLAAIKVSAGWETWTPTGGPIAPGGQVNGLAVHPAISGTVYAAVASLGAYDSGPSVIYKTTDGAATWTSVYTAEHQVYALAVTGTNVYAGAFNPDGEGPSIYLSDDSGVNWTPVFSFTERGVWLDIAVHPTDADVAIAGGWLDDGTNRDQGVVYDTDDGGLTWSPLLTVTYPGENSSVNAVLIHPVTPTLLLAAAHGDSNDGVIYRSADGGATWPVSVTIPNAQVMSLAANTDKPQMLYAGTGNSSFTWGPDYVFRSTDAGLSWTEVLTDGGGLLVFEPPSTVYAVAGWGEVWSSTSDGDPGTWNSVGGVWSPASFDIDLGPATAALYVGAWERGVHKSTDGGVGWEERNNGIETPVQPCDIDVDPQNLDKLFAAAECGGGWMTTDGGKMWTQPSGIGGCMGAFAVNPEDSDIVYGGAYDCGKGAVLRSEDGGLNFEPVYTATFIITDCSGGDEVINALAIAPSMSSTVYAAGLDHPNWEKDQAVIVRSLNDGVSWTEVFTLPPSSRVEALAINPTDDDNVYAGGEDCSGPDCVGFVYRTTDGGDNWTLVFTATQTVRSIVVDHQKPDVLYASDDHYNIHKSTDGGDTWTMIRTCCPSGDLLTIDPHVPSHVYLGGWGYIAETTDGGQTWSDGGDPINQGTPGMSPRALTVDNGTPTQTLYAGFSGVWYYGRLAPQPGTPVTVTAQSSAPSAPAGETVTISSLQVDLYENWVADGTVVTFTTSPVGSFASSTVTKTTTDGHAEATLTGVMSGTATITVTSGTGMDTLTVDFTAFKIYLPLVLRNF
jgi:photosystem II stability/assembly factor-like uncharacterized protein